MKTIHDKSTLIEALFNTREKITELVTELDESELTVPYHPGVNPPVWELGHSMFFYEVFLLNYLDGTPSYDPAMDELWDSFHMDHEDRWSRELFPSRGRVLEYADVIYKRVLDRLETQPLTDQALYLNRYAIYHQNMHIESMIWCRQTVGYRRPGFSDADEFPADSVTEAAEGDTRIPAGRYRIGLPGDSDEWARADFGFDNEKPGFDIELPAFSISRTLVSNAEFLRFVEDGGYERPELWSQGGKKWLKRRVDLTFGSSEAENKGQQRHPFYWRKMDGLWYERVFNAWLPLESDYPVKHISYWEAEAYCEWAGRRLPSEWEWEVAALGNRPNEPRRTFPWGNQLDPGKADMDGIHMGRVPVSAYANGESPFGCRQMIGTCWEWTSNQFLPYDGFTMDMYPFMSTLQFGDHKTTRGGSCATSSILIRGTYRQAYHPDRADVFTGFRTCARED